MKTKKEQEFMKEMQDWYIRFDWAIKRLLRQKANFNVLEGFLTVFLGEKITIVELLESEGNQLSADDKFNRVDINYLKDGTIRPDTTAPGLGEAHEKLRYYSMTPSERNAYDEHLSAIMIQNDVLDSAKLEGRIEGLAEGREENNKANDRKMNALGIEPEIIRQVTGLAPGEYD